MLAVAGALALCGWLVAPRVPIESDITKLVPQDLAEVRDLEKLEDATGVTGELDVVVTSDDMADPELVEWMADFKERVLERTASRAASRAAARPTSAPGPR